NPFSSRDRTLKTFSWMLACAMLSPLALDQALAMTEHQQDIAAWRASRTERLTAPDGWLSLIGLHWLSTGKAQTLGNGDGNDVDLERGPQRLGTLTWDEGRASFTVADGAVITVDGEPATRVDLNPPDERPAPVVRFGSVSFQMLERGGKYALRVKDNDAPTRTGFTGIPYFDIDPSWRIDARFEVRASARCDARRRSCVPSLRYRRRRCQRTVSLLMYNNRAISLFLYP
ncbi:MAG TPA: hypothetical protein PLF84_21345, partial [Bryobacteraceae bacterium]|nr:hypothetical protein [Bryobacteraceae bacterium]